MSASGIDLTGDWVLGSSFRLVPPVFLAITLHYYTVHGSSWPLGSPNTFLPVLVLPKENFQIYHKNYCLYKVWGYLNFLVFCGWLCEGSLVEKHPLKTARCWSSYTSLVLWRGCIFTLNTEMDIGGYVSLHLVFMIGLSVTCKMASAINSLLIVIYCFPVVE